MKSHELRSISFSKLIRNSVGGVRIDDVECETSYSLCFPFAICCLSLDCLFVSCFAQSLWNELFYYFHFRTFHFDTQVKFPR